jgi:hypothetical protein
VTTGDRDSPEYVVASREGLYVVNHKHWRRVADGYFFGVTVLGAHVYCFKTVSRETAVGEPRAGEIVRYRCSPGGNFSGPEILARGGSTTIVIRSIFLTAPFTWSTRGARA